MKQRALTVVGGELADTGLEVEDCVRVIDESLDELAHADRLITVLVEENEQLRKDLNDLRRMYVACQVVHERVST